MPPSDDARLTDFQIEAREAVEIHLTALDEVGAALIAAEARAQALGRAIDGFIEQVFQRPDVAKSLDDAEYDPNAFRYIPASIHQVIELMRELDGLLAADPDYAHSDLRYRPITFFEAGCGPGRNLLLLRTAELLLWSRAEGIDIVPTYIEVAREIFGLGEAVWCGDVMAHDFGAHDVVFSYRPFAETERQVAYERHVVETMAVGAYLVAPLSDTHQEDRRLLAKGPSDSIWKKLS